MTRSLAVNLALPAASSREVDIIGSFRYAHTYPLCLHLLSSGKVNTETLITHRYPFTAEGLAEGFATALDHEKQQAIKVLFDV